jgi:hypothetical protein
MPRHSQKSFFILLSIIFVATAFARTDSTKSTKTLSDWGTVFFGFSNTMGEIYGVEGYVWGFDLGMLVYPAKHKNKSQAILLGLGGAWIDNNINVIVYSDPNGPNHAGFPIALRYGGVRAGYVAFADRIVHPSFDVLIAAGSLSLAVPKNYFERHKDVLEEKTQAVFVIEPRINAEIMLTKQKKIGLGAGYRFVNGIAVPWFSNRDLSHFGFHGLFKIGSF